LPSYMILPLKAIGQDREETEARKKTSFCPEFRKRPNKGKKFEYGARRSGHGLAPEKGQRKVSPKKESIRSEETGGKKNARVGQIDMGVIDAHKGREKW